MKNFIKISVSPLVVGLIATILVFIDSLVAPLFVIGASFTWMSFVSWTVFFNAKFNERIKAIFGFIIGYIAANAIILIGNNMNILSLKLINISLTSLIAVFLINFLVMYFDNAKKIYMDSIPGIFVGIALTFSGAGVSLVASDLKLLFIIIIYGIFGLLCGLGTNIFVEKIKTKLKNN